MNKIKKINLSPAAVRRLRRVGLAAAILLACALLVLFLLRPRGVHTYLIYGVDSYGSLKENGRSDAMMLVQLDHTHGTVSVVSLARDMLVDNGRGARTKLNTVIRKEGTDEERSQRLCDTIESNFGVHPEGWFRINFSSLVSLVNAIGGVNVELTAEEAAYIDGNAGIWPGYPLKEGTCRLCGGQALSFVRCRHLDDDLGRGQRQSRFASALAAELKHMSPLRVLDLYNSMNHAWVSSLSAGEQLELVWQALWSCRDRFVRISVPFEGTWRFGKASDTDGILPDLAENRRLLLEALGRDAE